MAIVPPAEPLSRGGLCAVTLPLTSCTCVLSFELLHGCTRQRNNSLNSMLIILYWAFDMIYNLLY